MNTSWCSIQRGLGTVVIWFVVCSVRAETSVVLSPHGGGGGRLATRTPSPLSPFNTSRGLRVEEVRVITESLEAAVIRHLQVVKEATHNSSSAVDERSMENAQVTATRFREENSDVGKVGHIHNATAEEEEEEEHHHGKNILGHQMGALVVILATGCFGCTMPFWLRHLKAERMLEFANCFASGAFIGLALFHLLPEAILMTDSARVGIQVGKSWYNLTYCLAFCGYILILFFEKILVIPGMEGGHSHVKVIDNQREGAQCTASTATTVVGTSAPSASQSGDSGDTLVSPKPEGSAPDSQRRSRGAGSVTEQLTAFSAALALSVHSVFEGMVVGIVPDVTTVWVATLSIVGHKWAAGFALASNCVQQNTPMKAAMIYLGMFVIASPIGIGIGIPIKNESVTLAGIFNALSLGTILYVGTEMVNSVFDRGDSPLLRLLRFGLLVVGAGVVFGLMMLHLAFAGHTHNSNCSARSEEVHVH